MRSVVAIAAILTSVLGVSLEDDGTVGVPNADIVTIIHGMQEEIKVLKQQEEESNMGDVWYGDMVKRIKMLNQRDEDMAKEIVFMKQQDHEAKIKIRDLTNEIGFIMAKQLTYGKTLL